MSPRADPRGLRFAWSEERCGYLRANLDAGACGLTRHELRYIFDLDIAQGSANSAETFKMLESKEIRQYGEYRNSRLVLAAWDRMEASGEFTRLGM